MESHASVHTVDSNDILLARSHSSWSPSNGLNRVNLKLEKVTAASFSQSQESINNIGSQLIHSNLENEIRQPLTNIEKLNGNISKEFYRCQFCQESFTTKQALKHHKDSSHNERKTFRCIYANCLRAFTSANYLKNHVDIEHTDSTDSRIPCPKRGCGLVFPNNYRLKRHIRQDHKQEKLYHCTFCDRKFASLEVRNNHVNIKHGNTPTSEIYPLQSRNQDSNFYRSEQSKESENDTVYAASPISLRLKSISERRNDDNLNERAWITKPNDSCPLLSKQIDEIISDILSDNFQDKIYSPLSTNELAIAILSLEEVNEQIKHNAQKSSPHPETLISECNSPHRTNYLCLELNSKHSTSQNRLKNSQKYAHNISQLSQQNALINGQNYPQSNTESEGHSTESQRSFFINSGQHEEFSDISMESHLKDVFSNTAEHWSVSANVRTSADLCSNLIENPIKTFDYACLDTMFDDFHEIIMSDNVNTHTFINGHALNLMGYNQNLSNQRNHLLSLNNMHSKFLGGSQPNNFDFSSNRLVNVPSNTNIMLSNYEMNRRKVNNTFFINNKIQPSSYEMIPHFMEQGNRDTGYSIEGSSHCRNNLMNGTPHRQEPITRPGMLPNYPYNSANMLNNNQINHNRVANGVYLQSNERPNYPMCLNGSMNSNQLYQNSLESDFISDSMSQTGQFPNVYRRRAPPPSYQAAYSHQMLPSQHSAPQSYCPPSMQHRNNCFHPHNRSLYALPQVSSPSIQQQQQQQQQQPPQQQQQRQRHLLSDSPIIDERQGQPTTTGNHTAPVSIDNNPFSECEGSIVSEEQSSSIISNEQSTNHAMTNSNIGSQNMNCLSNPDQSGSGFSKNCDNTDAKSAVCS